MLNLSYGAWLNIWKAKITMNVKAKTKIKKYTENSVFYYSSCSNFICSFFDYNCRLSKEDFLEPIRLYLDFKIFSDYILLILTKMF